MSPRFSYRVNYNSSPYIKKRKKQFNLSMTLILIIINVIIYLIQNFIDYFTIDPVTSQGAFSHLFAITPAFIIKGQYLWSLVTNMFLHAPVWSPLGIFHILFNMVSLVFLGSFLERIIGKKRFLVIYLVSGFIASLLFVASALIFTQDLTIPAVGASGAIFGIGGVLALLTPKVKVYLMFIPIPMPLWLGMVIMLVAMWLLSIAVGLPVGNFAHLGGFLTGLVYGIYLRKKHRKRVQALDKYFSS
jgi:uncharacterized protein